MNRAELERQLSSLDPAVLSGLVGQVLSCPTPSILDWGYERISTGRGPATGGLYRIAGHARCDNGPAPWSLILKALVQSSPVTADPAHPLYWRREALVYESGWLNELPAELRAPRCYAIAEQNDGSCWLWLEDVHDRQSAWPLELFGKAAHGLGQFNGVFLTSRRLPNIPSLVQDGSPRGVLAAYAWVRDVIADQALWHHPSMQAAFPVPVRDRLLRLWDERDVLLDRLERGQYTLCHHDAWRGNLFAPALENPDQRLILIDWAYLGHGPLGTDAADLLPPSFSLFRADTDDLVALEKAIFSGYLAGLRDAGWQRDAAEVRFVYTAFAALKYGCLQFWLRAVIDEKARPAWEDLTGRTFDAFVRRQAQTIYPLLDLADEARGLL